MNSDLLITMNSFQTQLGDRIVPVVPFSLECRSGELVTVRGDNGSGKTTILDAIAARGKPDPRIRRSAHLKPTDVSYLPQQLYDVGDIVVAELRKLALGKRRGLQPPEQLSFLSKDNRREMDTLSGGQRQLLLFWLVASQRSPVFVYDEPFRHLDDAGRTFVRDTIQGQVSEKRLVIISDHVGQVRWTVPCRSYELPSVAPGTSRQ
jgi:ABC-type multidrug transport system ATPase subunit